MINSQKSFSLHDYLDVFLRRIWYFLIPLVIILAGTVTYAVMAPKWYRSSTLVLVSPQKISPDYVKATVTSSVEDRLASISQEILSRTRLEQVVTEFKLYPNQVKSHAHGVGGGIDAQGHPGGDPQKGQGEKLLHHFLCG